jgi:hypothetical protein
MDQFRRKTDGVIVRAYRRRDGGWLIYDEIVGVFRGVNDWYFSQSFEVVKRSEMRTRRT